MSAASDTVDHDILIDRQQTAFGIHGTLRSWISSFVKDRTQTVTLAGSRSNTSDVKYGVPQGSVIGPVLFLLYTAEVTAITHRHSIGAHSYADDTQLYIPRKAEDLESSIPHLITCIAQINCGMSASRLKLNTDKTQFILLGTRHLLVQVKRKSVSLDGVDISFSDNVTCLGVVFNNELEFSTHIKRLTGKCVYHLHQMRSVRCSLSVDAAKTLVNAFITSQIDYCNSVFSRVAVTHQSVLIAAARLIVKKCKYDTITATISDVLHWLPIQQRIEYRICDLVYKAMHHTAPVYLTELCVPVSIHQGHANLRSATHGDLSVAANKGTT